MNIIDGLIEQGRIAHEERQAQTAELIARREATEAAERAEKWRPHLDMIYEQIPDALNPCLEWDEGAEPTKYTDYALQTRTVRLVLPGCAPIEILARPGRGPVLYRVARPQLIRGEEGWAVRFDLLYWTNSFMGDEVDNLAEAVFLASGAGVTMADLTAEAERRNAARPAQPTEPSRPTSLEVAQLALLDGYHEPAIAAALVAIAESLASLDRNGITAHRVY